MTPSVVATLLRVVSGARAQWIGCEPSLRPRIYFANHTSHLDGPTIWAVLPPEIRQLARPVGARDYWSGGKIRQFMATRIFNTILIERKKPTKTDNPIDDMLRGMGETGSLILFPEGTRGPGPDPTEFKSGLYHMAKKRPDFELVPVLLDNMNRVLPKGELLPVPLICNVMFGMPMFLQDGEPRDEFLARARQAIINLRTDGVASSTPAPRTGVSP
jgi:1-acyl-sn-glycerol-3-phosphate acyltransferase